jgi:MFS family permease
VILAIIVTEFPEVAERAQAMSAYVFVSVAGGSIGLLAGGLLTHALSWHWVFFVNLPIGLATLALGNALIRADRGLGLEQGVDWVGSVLVTASLMSAIYAIVEATTHGWLSFQVAGIGAIAAVLMAAFLALEARIQNPIMPLRILRLRGLVNASLVRASWSRGCTPRSSSARSTSEHVRHYSALQTGAAFLPWTLTVAVLSQGITSRLVARFGPLPVLTTGMASAAAGLLLFATVGPDTAFFPTIFLACFAIGLGIGTAFMPLLTLAMADVPAEDAGLGSGITNLSQQTRRRARARRPEHHRREPHEGTGRRPRAHQLADRRLPARVHQRSGGHHDRDRPGVRAPQAAQPAAGAPARRRAGRKRPYPYRHRGPSSMTQTNRRAPHSSTAEGTSNPAGRPPFRKGGEGPTELRRSRRLLYPRARRCRRVVPAGRGLPRRLAGRGGVQIHASFRSSPSGCARFHRARPKAIRARRC